VSTWKERLGGPSDREIIVSTSFEFTLPMMKYLTFQIEILRFYWLISTDPTFGHWGELCPWWRAIRCSTSYWQEIVPTSIR